MTIRRAFFLASAALGAGCASVIGLSDFEVVDDTSDGGGVETSTDAPPSGITDAGVDAVVLPPVTCTAPPGTCAGLGLDPSWTPVGFAVTGAICPAGFDAGVPVLGPVAGSGGAPCSCLVAGTGPTNCSTESGETMAGETPDACAARNGIVYQAGGCVEGPQQFEQPYAEFVPPVATGATCTASIVADKTKVLAVPVTLCPATTCADTICAGNRLGELAACIVTDGDVACPAGKFTQKISIGTAVEGVLCSACSCTVGSQSCGGTIVFYETPSCNGQSIALEAGVCTPVSETKYNGAEYTPSPSFEPVVDGGDLLGATFSGQRTLCCAP